MSRDLLNTFILAGLFLSLFGVAEFLYHRLKVKSEYTRKLVHVGTGLLTLLFPIMLGNHWLVLFLCASFAVILILSLKFDLLKSINAIDRVSIGSIAYPISVYGCYLAFDYFNHRYAFFYLPVLILAICDPMAALCGKQWPIGKYAIGNENKTIVGSLAFILSAGVIIILLPNIFQQFTYQHVSLLHILIFVPLIAAISEALSRKGSDNLSIPASVLITLIFLEKLT